MARKDRTLPPHSLKITDYDVGHMEDFHKRTYKSFLAMRQNIKREYAARATRRTVDSKIYYERYNLRNNVYDGSFGSELLRWHGMAEEGIQEIRDFQNSTDLERLQLEWNPRLAYDTIFFNTIEQTIQNIIAIPQGIWIDNPIETDLNRSGVTTDTERGVWNIYFALNLINITNVANEMVLVINTVLRQEIINAVEAGDTIPDYDLKEDPDYIIGGDLDRAQAGIQSLYANSDLLFYIPPQIEIGYIMQLSNTLLSKERFEVISQDEFFDSYAQNIFVDWKEDKNWFEKFIGGLLKLIGNIINLVLDVLLSIPLFGEVLEFIIDGIASLFGLTLAEARAILVQIIVFIIAAYLTIPTGGASMYAYLDWVSTAWTLGGIAGDATAMTYESPVATIEAAEEEELKREIEKMQGEHTMILEREEPYIRMNRPEEELRVDGDNNSTYNIFRLD